MADPWAVTESKPIDNWAVVSSQPTEGMTTGEKFGSALRQVGEGIISPIMGIPDAVREVGDFLKNPNEWAKKHFDPSQAQMLPGASGNPIQEAAPVIGGAALGVALGDVAPIASKAATATARTVSNIASDPAAQEVAGVISPRLKHGMEVITRAKKAAEAYSKAKAEAVKPPVSESPSSTPQEISRMPPAQAAEAMRGKGMSQATKDAGKMVDVLAEKWKFSPDELKSMNEKGWDKLAFDAGVPAGATKAMKSRVFEGLAHKLAGPPRSPLELMEQLKASLAGGAQ